MRWRVLLLGSVVLVGFSFVASAQSPDYAVIILDSENPSAPDQTVGFIVQVANTGTDGTPTIPIMADIYLPMDVPGPWQTFIDADAEGQAAIVDAFLASANIVVDDSIWNDDLSGIFVGESFNNGCESMMVQVRDLVLPGATSGGIHYDVQLPASGGVSGVAYDLVSGQRVEVKYGFGGCNSIFFDSCANIPCMGPRLTMIPSTGLPVSPVDDGQDPIGDGCQDFLATFPAGHVALVDRGSCNFSVKAENATNAGASGVIIANTEMLGSMTPTEDSIMVMSCTDSQCHSQIITIPAAFISFNSGEALKAAMSEGEVIMYMGIREENPEYKQTKAYIWESTPNDLDSNTDNNRFTKTTTLSVPIFTDGFESGDTSAW